MGCATVRSNSQEQHDHEESIVLKNSSLQVKISDVSELSKKSSCLKFNISLDSYNHIESDIAYVYYCELKCAKNFEKLMKVYQKYISSYSYLETKTHGICMPDYNLAKSIRVLVVYLKHKYGLAEDLLTKKEKFPYFSIDIKQNSHDDVLSAFEDYIKIIESVLKNKDYNDSLLHVKYVYKVVKDLNQQLDNNPKVCLKKALKILKSCIQYSEKMFESLKNDYKILKSFHLNFDYKIKELYELGSTERDLSITTKYIVHALFS